MSDNPDEQGKLTPALSKKLPASLKSDARNGNLQPILAALEAKEIDINATDGAGWTMLHHAAWTGEADVVTYLLNHDADLMAETLAHENALYLVCQSSRWKAEPKEKLAQRIDIVEGLLMFGLEPSCGGGCERAPADVACPEIKKLVNDYCPTSIKPARG